MNLTLYSYGQAHLGRKRSMDMDRLLPDLPLLPPDKEGRWAVVEVRFIGAENYVLGIKRGQARIVSTDGGFRIQFKDRVALPAEELMGKKIRSFVLFDVELHFSEIMLSLKALEPGSFPRTYTEGTVIGLLRN